MLVVPLDGQPDQGEEYELYTLVRKMDVMVLHFRLMHFRTTV
ncbi:hypothetical protein [Mumia zhuanghuii]|nr:hypothetical protein [Mumia zhuanghuii]